ncbi:hypothetical protein CSHISOI_09459 [Colletotrichum shisoi]|uniref:Uncharacterized protein n=1 Tax=Colletotrichum shisoi TaxID=2078593 RepID=A0A5Q4BG92_9PEZI|nr:hypothetical protein CSHISOI_09459 [Colletotrichum shisoi]
MKSLQPLAVLSYVLGVVVGFSPSRRQASNSTLGPIHLGIPTSQIASISVSLITFSDEVFDISGISIFGNVNDGSVNCTAESGTGSDALVGPVPIPGEGSRQINLSLITFADEVVDFSNVAVFGDVNDVGCE